MIETIINLTSRSYNIATPFSTKSVDYNSLPVVGVASCDLDVGAPLVF